LQAQADRPWLKAKMDGRYGLPRPEAKPLYSILTDSAKVHPQNSCVYFQGKSYTYAQVDELTSRFASALLSLGLKKGDRVAIFLPNVPQFVFAYFGVLKAGGIVVTCNPIYKERELEHQLKDSGAEIVVASRSIVKGLDLFGSLEASRPRLSLRHVIATGLTDYIPSIKKPFVGLVGIKNVPRKDTLDFADLINSNRPVSTFASVDPLNDVAQLQYTGGTTGVSKGAMLTHYNLVSNAMYMTQILPVTEKDVSLCALPLFHIYGLTVTMNAPIASGASIVLLANFHVEEVAKTIEKMKVTLFSGAPAMYIAINSKPNAKDFKLGTVRA